MMKDIAIFIEHITESIDKIEEYSENLTKEKLIKDSIIQDAIVRRIEIIGEAAKNLSDDFKEKNSFIPWREIIGTRDKIIHHYFGVNLDMIWEIITINIPDLKIKILKIKKELEPQ
ncbi:DUF86 domain-containing protein [Candidatus Pacearchaeota archaeon]|nr:DUF86 domain-containing protein [Candidatus Pacearchaeota archaeon]